MKKNGIKLHFNNTGYRCIVYAEKCERPKFEGAESYTTWRRVYPYGNSARTIVYLAKGNKDAPNEVVPFYPNGRMHISFSNNLVGAFKMAIEDAINYI